MAIVRALGKPSYFITMTCNPGTALRFYSLHEFLFLFFPNLAWKEITDALPDGQEAKDRPDIVNRVFQLKAKELIKDIVKGQVLGHAAAWFSVIEFQKRG